MNEEELKKELKEMAEYLRSWRDGSMVEATTTYRCLRKDREVYAFGWRMGVDSVLSKIEQLIK